jgi:hypothetical protein
MWNFYVPNYGLVAYECVAPWSQMWGGCNPNPLGSVFSWSADLIARLNDPSVRWSPYAILGAALYAYPADRSHVMRSPPALAGLQTGVGFEVRIGKRTTLFGEYRHMTVGVGSVAPVTYGMRF